MQFPCAALAILHGGDELPAVLQDIAQFVELRVEARTDDAGLCCKRWRIIRNASRDRVADVAHLVHLLAQGVEPSRNVRTALAALEHFADARNFLERGAQGQQVSRRGDAERHAARQPLEIEDSFELLANLFADDRLIFQLRDGVEALLDLVDRNFRTQNPRAQKTRSHARRGFIDRVNQSGGRVVAAYRLDQFQISRGHLIEDHRVLLLVIGDAIEMLEAGARRPQPRKQGRVLCFSRADRGRFAQVMHDRSCGCDRLRMAGQPKSFEAGDVEMSLEFPRGVAGFENPIVELRFNRSAVRACCCARVASIGEKCDGPRQKNFARAQDFEFIAQAGLGFFA